MKEEWIDRVQNMLPQDMALWHSEYFKLKEFEKQQVQEGLSGLPPKQIVRPSVERCPPTEASLSLEVEGHQQESEQTGLAKFPPVYQDDLIPYFVLSLFATTFPFFIKPNIKILL